MQSPVEILFASTSVFLAALVLIVIFKIISGSINTRYLLADKSSDNREFSPVRLQLLMFTIFAVADFVWSADFQQKKLPEVNETLLYLLMGSQAVYLAGKGNSVFGFLRSVKLLR